VVLQFVSLPSPAIREILSAKCWVTIVRLVHTRLNFETLLNKLLSVGFISDWILYRSNPSFIRECCTFPLTVRNQTCSLRKWIYSVSFRERDTWKLYKPSFLFHTIVLRFPHHHQRMHYRFQHFAAQLKTFSKRNTCDTLSSLWVRTCIGFIAPDIRHFSRQQKVNEVLFFFSFPPRPT